LPTTFVAPPAAVARRVQLGGASGRFAAWPAIFVASLASGIFGYLVLHKALPES
jgi:hypothetical protein